jgi:hypothetical protein
MLSAVVCRRRRGQSDSASRWQVDIEAGRLELRSQTHTTGPGEEGFQVALRETRREDPTRRGKGVQHVEVLSQALRWNGMRVAVVACRRCKRWQVDVEAGRLEPRS